MNRKKILLTVLLGGMGVLLFLSATPDGHKVASRDEPELAKASLRDFSIKVNTIGVLDAARAHMISSEIKSDSAKIIFLAEDGRHVNKGDVLVKIDSAPFEEKKKELEGDIRAFKAAEEAKMQLLEWEKNQVEKTISSAQYNLKVAKLELEKLIKGDAPLKLSQYKSEEKKAKEELERYKLYLDDLHKLKAKGYAYDSEISKAENKILELGEKYQSARKRLLSYENYVLPSLKKTGEAKVEKLEQELVRLKQGGTYKIEKAIAELEETRALLSNKRQALEKARKELANTVIKAPFDGIIIHYETYRNGEKRKPRVGDRVIRNQPILYFPDVSEMIVKTHVREIDLHKIDLGHKANIQVDAYPDLVFKGTVDFIGALASERKGTGGKYFDLTVSIETEALKLRPGMTARIGITSARVKNALSIPVHAVFSESDGSFCYLYENGRFGKVEVTTGRQNENYIEIVEGLSSDDQVSMVKPESS